MVARVPGLTIRFEAKRAARGQLPWGVFIDLRLGGERHPGAKFFATEAEAEAHYPYAAAEVMGMRESYERELRLKRALNVPALPQAPKGTVLFETMTQRWLTEHVKEMCTAATYLGYKGLLKNHLLPIMRSWPMHNETMTGQRIKDVLKVQLAKNKVPLPTRLACQATLSAFFGWAKNELPPGQFTVNPAEGIGKYVRNENEKRIVLHQQPNPMTRVQVDAFLKWQHAHYPELYPLFVWLADEGSRIGEACALKWDHLDLSGGKGHVVEAFSAAHRKMELQDGHERGVGEKDTKTHRADQYVDLSPRVVEVYGKLKVANREAWLKRGRRPIKEPQHCVLTSVLSPRRPDKVVYGAFRKGCEALSLKGQTGKRFTIHCLRDTFATLALLEGKPLGWVSMMLGHEDTETTRKHYIKWVRLVEENLLAKGQE